MDLEPVRLHHGADRQSPYNVGSAPVRKGEGCKENLRFGAFLGRQCRLFDFLMSSTVTCGLRYRASRFTSPLASKGLGAVGRKPMAFVGQFWMQAKQKSQSPSVPAFFFAERPVATRAHSHTYAALDTSVIRSKILLAAHLTDFGGVEARPFHEPFMLRAFLIADRLKPSPAVADVILNGSKLFGDVFVPEIADANTIVIEINNFFIALFLQNNKHPPKKKRTQNSESDSLFTARNKTFYAKTRVFHKCESIVNGKTERPPKVISRLSPKKTF